VAVITETLDEWYGICLRWTVGRPMARRASLDNKLAAILVVVLLSLLGVTGDYFLKLASGEDRFIWNRWFPIGLAIYASTAFGWVYALKHMKLATIGVVYSMCMILFLAVLGIAVFSERLTLGEVVGIVMAVGSLILLSRFAG
jgi:drug/metabolite transporter (DMT)-like permease